MCKTKFRSMAAIFLTVCMLCACSSSSSIDMEVPVDYGESSLYTEEDMQEVITLIMAEFLTWDGRQMTSIAYMGDDVCDEITEYCNSLFDDKNYVESMGFTTEYTSGSSTSLAASSGVTIPDLLWYAAREEDGEWELVSWGYDGIMVYSGTEDAED